MVLAQASLHRDRGYDGSKRPEVMLPKKIWLYVCLFACSIAVTSASITFAYLAGFGMWLQERPPSFWLVSLGFCFFAGIAAGGGTIIWLERRLSARIKEVGSSDPEMREALGRILFMLAANRTAAANKRERRLAEAVLLLTRSSVVDGQCMFCGSTHKGLLSGGEFDPVCHNELTNAQGKVIPCPAPYARKLANDVKLEVSQKQMHV